jgi:Dolichyl-phosphate-mannose-protein mannosyltransferase
MTWLWGSLAALALLWPDRISGPMDGVPLDQTVEAILVGVLFPALWWFQPRFLRSSAARAAIVLLIIWKVSAAVLLVPDGWCVHLTPARAYVRNGTGAPHSWDLRADWRSPDPACTAIMTRPYERLADFPAWFFNLAPPDDNALEKGDRPPDAIVAMSVQGFLGVPEAGLLHVDTSDGVTASIRVDGGPQAGEVRLTPGVHTVNIEATLTGDRWRFVPIFNGRNVFAATTPTVKRPGRFALAARPWIGWIPPVLAAGLIASWLVFAAARAGDPVLLSWATLASTIVGLLVTGNRVDDARWMIAALGAAVLLPFTPRVRNVFGAFVVIGIPWLTFVVASTLPAIGQFTLYAWGNDWWSFQRYAYRIVLQGYWLEGGSPTFWFQPLYRWIAALLHVVFGDSSVGETYWDGACLLAGALFSFQVVRRYAGWRWGLIAAAATLSVFILSNERVFLGLGLGEISSAGLIYLAASFVMRSRHRRFRWAVAGGVVATLGFYTRLNNLPMALGTAAFALPADVAGRSWFRPWIWWPRVEWRSVLIVAGVIGAGIVLFAWRTWHYTGVFSLFYGTSRDQLAIWQPGMGIRTVLDRAIGSVLMVLSLNDPARYDPYAIPVAGGAAVAVLSLLGVPRLRTLPLALVLFFLSTIVGALVARGSAYAGRFSLHVIPVTCALSVAALASLGRPEIRSRRHDT